MSDGTFVLSLLAAELMTCGTGTTWTEKPPSALLKNTCKPKSVLLSVLLAGDR